MIEPLVKKLAIFGVGLIGGSFALALKQAGAVREVVGFGRNAATLADAVILGIIDRIGEDLIELADADLVLLAVPVGQMAGVMARIAPHLGKSTVITDGGSTKRDVTRHARENLGVHLSNFVPAHPIAGAENSGPSAARADLFEGKKVVLTPLPDNPRQAVARVQEAWEACGATVTEMSPEAHDAVFAAVSHLPHLLSFALVHDLAGRKNRELLLSFAASGFRDFTRIAASSPEMWRDICLSNREALLVELERYMHELESVRDALDHSDAEKLEDIFFEARKLRSGWTQQ